MNWTNYVALFEDILSNKITTPPYDDAHFFEYTKLNQSRMQRWLKTGVLLPETVKAIHTITTTQYWEVIAEPWCGDAAHILPFIYKMASLNNCIHLNIQLRDENSEIEKYLFKGTKSIPVLVIRDENKNDLHVWGPRPKEAQALYDLMREEQKEKEEIKMASQQWYNQHKGIQIQEEICNLILIESPTDSKSELV